MLEASCLNYRQKYFNKYFSNAICAEFISFPKGYNKRGFVNLSEVVTAKTLTADNTSASHHFLSCGPLGTGGGFQTLSHLLETKHGLVNWSCEDKIVVLWSSQRSPLRGVMPLNTGPNGSLISCCLRQTMALYGRRWPPQRLCKSQLFKAETPISGHMNVWIH